VTVEKVTNAIQNFMGWDVYRAMVVECECE